MSRLLALLVVVVFVGPVSAHAQDEPRAGEERKFEIAPGVFMEFCWIPPGEAQLGSPKDEQDYITKTFFDEGKRPDFLDDETETKRGKFMTKGFWLGKYPVTQAEWKAVMGNNPSDFDGTKDTKAKGMNTERFPVENVSWNDCQKFLMKVNERGGVPKVFGKDGKLVLPHEDQWEYACRGGRGNKRPFYWGSELNRAQANCDGNFPYGADKDDYLKRTCAVDFTNGGKYEKHPWGLHHMSGNVWQCCDNLYAKTTFRVLRGGAWSSSAWGCRSANRDWSAPDVRFHDVGFRVCLPLET